MRGVDLLTFLGGLGVFLFSLRFLTGVLERTIAHRFRPILAPALATPFRAFVAGFAITGVVQASSITVIAAMGLLSTALITLEQALFVMLGATLGTTLKFWIFAGHLALGRVFVGVGSLGYLFLRNPLAREALEVVLAAGFALLGLEMMGQGVAGLASQPGFMQMLAAHDAVTLKSQLLAAITGCIFTVALQSSSAMLFTAMAFAAQGVITVPAGAALVLGVNVGTTVTALVASIEVDWRGKRLALAHLLIKMIGAAVALFFFPTFVGLVERFASLGAADGAMRLAIAHTLFNLLNVLAWWAGAGFFLRVLRAITPEESNGGQGLPPVVRRMLASSPDRALAETRRQMDRLRHLSKAQLDECVGLLARPGAEIDASPLVVRSFDHVREGLQELIVQLMRSPIATAHGEHLRSLLAVIDACHALHEEAVALRTHVVRGRVADGFLPPESMKEPLEALARAFDGRWLQVVFPNATPEALTPNNAVLALQTAFPDHAKGASVRIEALTWLQEGISRLGRLAVRLDELLEAERRLRREGGQPAVVEGR
jgi:phosphate:Na+ symporter